MNSSSGLIQLSNYDHHTFSTNSLILENILVIAEGLLFGAVLCIFGFRESISTKVPSERINPPPGPRGIPIFGNLPYLSYRYLLHQEHLQRTLQRLAGQFGPILSLELGPVLGRTVVISDYRLIREALVDNNARLADRPDLYFQHLLSDFGSNIFHGPDGPVRTLQKRIVFRAYKEGASGHNLIRHIAAGCEVTMSQLDVLASRGAPANPRDAISLGIVTTFRHLLCNRPYHSLQDEDLMLRVRFLRAYLWAVGAGVPGDLWRGFRYLPDPRHVWLRRKGVKAKELMDRLYREHAMTHDPCAPPTCVLDSVLNTRRELGLDEPGSAALLTHTHYLQLLMDINTTGVESTTEMTSWAMVHAALNPAKQLKAFQQIHSTLDAAEPLDWTTSSRLPYLEAFVLEVMRLSDFLSLAVPHMCTEDTKIAGYDIRRGDTVIINLFTMHRDPELWRDPEQFIPERFLDGEGRVALPREGYLPFGLGRRKCLGQVLSKPLLVTFVGNVLRRFELFCPPGAPRPSTEGFWQSSVMHVPETNYTVGIRRR